MLRYEASANRALLSGHGDTDGRRPAAPTTSWECGRVAGAQTTEINGWTFSTPAVSCPGSRVVVQDVGVGVGQVSIAPGNFRSTVTGTTVRLDWNPVLEPVITYLRSAGSAPGLSNLADTLFTGNAAASLVVNGVPPGQYFVRVRGVGPDNIPGPASNEIIVTVGTGGSCPGSPVGLTQQVTNNTVNLTWGFRGGR